MQTKDHFAAATSLRHPTTPLSSLGAHTAAPNRAPAPAATGSLTNRGGGARPIKG